MRAEWIWDIPRKRFSFPMRLGWTVTICVIRAMNEYFFHNNICFILEKISSLYFLSRHCWVWANWQHWRQRIHRQILHKGKKVSSIETHTMCMFLTYYLRWVHSQTGLSNTLCDILSYQYQKPCVSIVACYWAWVSSFPTQGTQRFSQFWVLAAFSLQLQIQRQKWSHLNLLA